jgi:hypothetical protein
MEGRCGIHAGDATLRSVAADAKIDHSPDVALRVELSLQVVGEALAGIEAIAGGEAVTKYRQNLT